MQFFNHDVHTETHTEKIHANTSDEEILAFSMRSPSVFAILVDRYQKAFMRKAEHILKSREDAEDVVQETFTKIYMYAGKFSVVDGATFSSWGYKILMNTAFTRYQKIKKIRDSTVFLEPELYEAIAGDAGDAYEEREMREQVGAVIARMPEMLGRILKLHFLDDMSQKEIADKEGISLSAVKTRVHRAKKEFKKMTPLLIF